MAGDMLYITQQGQIAAPFAIPTVYATSYQVWISSTTNDFSAAINTGMTLTYEMTGYNLTVIFDHYYQTEAFGIYHIFLVAVHTSHLYTDSDPSNGLTYSVSKQLDTPENLAYDELTGMLTWDAVDNAEDYEIIIEWYIGGVRYEWVEETDQTNFDASAIVVGNNVLYTFRVRALTTQDLVYTASPYAYEYYEAGDVIDFTDLNLDLEDRAGVWYAVWDLITGATGYRIVISAFVSPTVLDVVYTADLGATVDEYDLSFLTVPGTYFIFVMALGDTDLGDSSYATAVHVVPIPSNSIGGDYELFFFNKQEDFEF
jgi:hypothetical protein